MSQLYMRSRSDDRKEVTRRGHRRIETSVNGWHVGVDIIARYVDGKVIIDAYQTGGSNGGKGSKHLATITEE